MAILWRSSSEVFAQILRRYGVDPAAVTSVEAAWQAFGEFLQVGVDGIDTDPDSDADGFIVSWGRYSWNDGRPSLSFMRQLAVADVGQQHPGRPQELWQISLEMSFDDEPDLGDVDDQDTGFHFDPIGPRRIAELAEIRTDMQGQPQLRSMWRMTPVSSDLSFEAVC